MEAIKAIAKRTKAVKYKIELPINKDAEEIAVIVIVEERKKKKSMEGFAGKMHSNIDWIAYQKKQEMSGNKILLDTNAVGLYLGDGEIVKKYLNPNAEVFISVITLLEFLSTPELTPKNRFIFDEFIEFIEICPVTRENKELVNQAVPIRKKYKLKLPDAIIAETAITNNAALLNAHIAFSKIFNLKFQLIKA